MSYYIRLALRYLWGRKLRTILTTLAIAFGTMLIFGMNGLVPAVEAAYRQQLMQAASQVDLTITGETRSSFPETALEVVRGTPGVAHASGSLVRPVVVPPADAPLLPDGSRLGTIVLSGIDPETAPQVRRFEVVSGRLLQPGDRNVLVVSESLARKASLEPGDRLRLPSATGVATFEIVGVIAGEPGAVSDEVYTPLPVAQALLNQPGRINTIEALVVPGSDARAVREAALARLGSGFKLGENQVGSELQAAVEMGEVAFNLFGVLTLAMGGFIIFNTFRTVVVERRRDIGMLRAVGASRRAVIGLILTESLLQGVVGTAAGLCGGYFLALGMGAIVGPIWSQALRLSLGGPVFKPATYVLAIGLGIGVTLVAGLWPAVSAGRVTPLEALRPAEGEASWKPARRRAAFGLALVVVAVLGLASGNLNLASLGAVLFLAGLVLVGPVLVRPIAGVFGRLLELVLAQEGRIAEGNLARQPGRAAITASAMTIGLAILVALGGMTTSLESGLFRYIDQSLGADYLLMPHSMVLGGGNVGAGPELAEAVRSVPGIAEVTTVRLAMGRIGDTDVQTIGIDPESYPRVAGLEFSAGEPEEAFAALAEGRALIANGIFSAQSRLQVGEELTLQTPEGPKTYRVAGIGMDFLNAKLATVYVSQENLARDLHETSDILLMADRAADADPAEVRAQLERIVAQYPAFSLLSGDEMREEYKQMYGMAMRLLHLLMVTLAIPSLIALMNTLGINVLERTREIGVLRAVGSTRRQVQRMIVGESLLLSALGTAFGLLGGLWLGYVLVGALNATGFKMSYFFPYSGIVLAVAVGLVFGVIAALLPARRAARLDLLAALRYE
ncbi:MAG: ABC transporter permease [Anaerolineae bacterium]|nr:ABC transporter permease [Anaerolineae bacterium]